MHIFMLIGEKQRSIELRNLIIDIIQKQLKIPFNEEVIQNYYTSFSQPYIELI